MAERRLPRGEARHSESEFARKLLQLRKRAAACPSERAPFAPDPDQQSQEMNRPVILSSALTVAAALSSTAAIAQSSLVVPPSANIYSTPDSNAYMLASTPGPVAHCQFLYETAGIPVSVATLRSLQLRPVAKTPLGTYSTVPTALDMTITMSLSPTAPGAASSNFASNLGFAPVQVFRGRVSLSGLQPQPTWPAAWQAPVVFTTPFPFVRSGGASLVVDIVASNRSSNTFWPVEEYREDFGTLELGWHDFNCKTAANRSPGLQYDTTAMIPGGFLWQVTCCYSNKPSFATNVLFFGIEGPGGTYLGRTLPLPLQSLGLPAMPACNLAVAPLFGIPMQYFPGSGAAATTRFQLGPIPIPNDPLLVHSVFHTQHVLLDTDAGQNHLLYPAASYEWRIGSGALTPASTVYAGDATAATGSVTLSRGVTLQFGF